LIQVYQYNAQDNRSGELVKKGRDGTPYYVAATDYLGDTDPNSENKHLVTKTFTYPAQTTTRSQGIATTRDYTFWPSGHVKTIQTTLPAMGEGTGLRR
jgi:hypothetical protein